MVNEIASLLAMPPPRNDERKRVLSLKKEITLTNLNRHHKSRSPLQACLSADRRSEVRSNNRMITAAAHQLLSYTFRSLFSH
jgi:hypothetical protein